MDFRVVQSILLESRADATFQLDRILIYIGYVYFDDEDKIQEYKNLEALKRCVDGFTLISPWALVK